MIASMKARDKVLASTGQRLDFKTGRVHHSTRVVATQDVYGKPGSSGVAKTKMIKKCVVETGVAPCTDTMLKEARKKRKSKAKLDKLKKHLATKSVRLGAASKPKVRRVSVVDQVRRRK